MLSRIKARVGSAHVIALLALVMAVTGTSIALPGRNSVDSGDLKKNSVTSAKIKNKTIGSGDIRANAFNGNQINEAKLSTVPTAGRSTDTHWVVVNNPAGATNATVARASAPAPTITETGAVQVAYGFNVTACAWVPTKSSPGNEAETSGYAQADGLDGNPNVIEVRTRDKDGVVTDGNFHLLVVC